MGCCRLKILRWGLHIPVQGLGKVHWQASLGRYAFRVLQLWFLLFGFWRRLVLRQRIQRPFRQLGLKLLDLKGECHLNARC